MKKNILFFCAILTTFSLMAFGFVNWSHTETDKGETPCISVNDLGADNFTSVIPKAGVELFYDFGNRFGSTVTKEDLNMAQSFLDIVPADIGRSIVSYSSVTVNILDDYYKTVISETGDGYMLTAAQIKLLRSVAYSTDILIRVEYQEKNRETGALEDSYATPHLTVVPEKQAACNGGKEALIAYVKENTKEFATKVKEDELKPGKITFTVTKEGKVAKASITETSGYPAFDKKMADLISSMPETWEPARNSNGEKVAQKFVFFFGIGGC